MTVMVVNSKGAPETTKAVMKDLSKMIDAVIEPNFDLKKKCFTLEKYMDVNDCDTTIFFEMTKRSQKMYIATATLTARFLIHSIESVYDMSTLVNYHERGGHVLCFTADFDGDENLKTVKSLIETAFGQNKNESKERAMCFYHFNNRIYMRNYVIEGMEEVGPRLEFELECIIQGCFRGEVTHRKSIPE